MLSVLLIKHLIRYSVSFIGCMMQQCKHLLLQLPVLLWMNNTAEHKRCSFLCYNRMKIACSGNLSVVCLLLGLLSICSNIIIIYTLVPSVVRNATLLFMFAEPQQLSIFNWSFIENVTFLFLFFSERYGRTTVIEVE